mmetsp:Transcript_6063/g.17700  ORF Transcript_6063/g.17700 Transcript_6063/m.17700 type:complete len:175 (-) Transcript_6063:282-806(-)
MFHDDTTGNTVFRQMIETENKAASKSASAALPSFRATSNPNPPPLTPGSQRQNDYKVTAPWLHSARSSSLDEGAKQAMNSVRSSARSSARRSGRLSARDTQGQIVMSGRQPSGRLDTIRSDMSTSRLESELAVLLAEKSNLLQRLAKVEEELEVDTKKNPASTRGKRGAARGRR